MFPIAKLGRLGPRHRLRKAALLLLEVERNGLAGGPEAAAALAYGRGIAAWLAADSETPEFLRKLAAEAGDAETGPGEGAPAEAGPIRALNALRHALLRETGQAPADWDLLDPATGRLAAAERLAFPGCRAYLEDIRSPFNLGSIFRSAEAFGLEELVLSESTADPEHPRAARSAMGARGVLPWRRAGLEALEELGPAFALELGGTPLGEFEFPERGIVVLGSEELGVSRDALRRSSLGKVSIPLSGAKASLNVGVAFGILAQAWTAALRR